VSGRFAGERALVVGFGASGQSAAVALRREGATVRVSELRAREAVELTVDHSEVEVLWGGHRPEHLEGITVVVTSPGVPEPSPLLQAALDRGLPVWSELELAARLCDVPIVAVTGTNGKTTTTELVASMLRRAGLRARACGNVGYPFSAAVTEEVDALSVEVSSFQLRFVETFHPRVSVLLNVAPDHLDWHGSLAAYAEAKARIFARQGSGDVHIGNADDPAGAEVSRGAPCEVRWFREGPPSAGDVGVVDGRIVAAFDPPVELGRPPGGSPSFLSDTAAAAAAALAFGAPAEAVAATISESHPGPHRGTEVARLGSVRFVDDSKATNPHAALAALEGLHDVVLIAGGLAKGLDLSPLRHAAPRLSAVVAIGQAAPQVAEVFSGMVKVRTADSMEQAVAVAAEEVAPDGTVLLAPACASQDMFRDYGDRGDRFAAAARAEVARRERAAEPTGRGRSDG
jgi:UDP-N-acetylmuramoylalanine--D-glutamate ligase